MARTHWHDPRPHSLTPPSLLLILGQARHIDWAEFIAAVKEPRQGPRDPTSPSLPSESQHMTMTDDGISPPGTAPTVPKGSLADSGPSGAGAKERESAFAAALEAVPERQPSSSHPKPRWRCRELTVRL